MSPHAQIGEQVSHVGPTKVVKFIDQDDPTMPMVHRASEVESIVGDDPIKLLLGMCAKDQSVKRTPSPTKEKPTPKRTRTTPKSLGSGDDLDVPLNHFRKKKKSIVRQKLYCNDKSQHFNETP